MNIALEKSKEYVNGDLRQSYGDAFVRGNNGWFWCCPRQFTHCSNMCLNSVLYISAQWLLPLFITNPFFLQNVENKTWRWPSCEPRRGGVEKKNKPMLMLCAGNMEHLISLWKFWPVLSWMSNAHMLTIIIRAQARTTLHICTFIHPDADISRGVSISQYANYLRLDMIVMRGT